MGFATFYELKYHLFALHFSEYGIEEVEESEDHDIFIYC